MLWPLQQAIHAALTGDATLMAKITGVHDDAPQNDAFPYVIIGDGEAREWDTDTEQGFEVEAVIHVWDRGHRGRRQVRAIQADIARILHREDLAIDGAALVGCTCESTETFRDADGLTNHGTQRFRILIEEQQT